MRSRFPSQVVQRLARRKKAQQDPGRLTLRVGVRAEDSPPANRINQINSDDKPSHLTKQDLLLPSQRVRSLVHIIACPQDTSSGPKTTAVTMKSRAGCIFVRSGPGSSHPEAPQSPSPPPSSQPSPPSPPSSPPP